MAGLIKAALSLKRGVIPKHLHFHNPNPAFDWESHPLQVTSSTMEWPDYGRRPRLAGVNSFGITGTNSHIVMEEYAGPHGEAGLRHPAPVGSAQAATVPLQAKATGSPLPDDDFVQRPLRLLPLSGKSEGALRDLARRHLSWLDTQAETLASTDADWGATLSDLAWTASVGRSHFERRSGVVFGDANSLRQQLDALSGGVTRRLGLRQRPRWHSSTPVRAASGSAWDEPCMKGNQWPGPSWTAARRFSRASGARRCWT